MKKLIVSALALILGGCAPQFGQRLSVSETISAVANFSVTQGQLDTARASYDGVVLAPLRRYAVLPRCRTGQSLTINNPCHDRKLLKQLRETDRVIEKSFIETQISIDSNDNKGAIIAYEMLTRTIELAKSLIGKTGVNVL